MFSPTDTCGGFCSIRFSLFWEFQQTEMHSLFVLKAFLVGWKGAAARLIMFISEQIALLK